MHIAGSSTITVSFGHGFFMVALTMAVYLVAGSTLFRLRRDEWSVSEQRFAPELRHDLTALMHQFTFIGIASGLTGWLLAGATQGEGAISVGIPPSVTVLGFVVVTATMAVLARSMYLCARTTRVVRLALLVNFIAVGAVACVRYLC